MNDSMDQRVIVRGSIAIVTANGKTVSGPSNDLDTLLDQVRPEAATMRPVRWGKMAEKPTRVTRAIDASPGMLFHSLVKSLKPEYIN